MSEKKYLYVVSWNEKIVKTEISRETEKSFWDIHNYRQSKSSNYYNAFNTLKEASLFLIYKKKKQIEQAETKISFWADRVPKLEQELKTLEANNV